MTRIKDGGEQERRDSEREGTTTRTYDYFMNNYANLLTKKPSNKYKQLVTNHNVYVQGNVDKTEYLCCLHVQLAYKTMIVFC